MNCWLVKQEPADYPFARFVEEKRTGWTGVRNFQARNNLRAMKQGDRVLYYHSGEEKAVVGTARVSREAFADPTVAAGDPPGEWFAVELSANDPFARPVPLAAIKADPALRGLPLVRQSRLSVMPVSRAEFDHILTLARR